MTPRPFFKVGNWTSPDGRILIGYTVTSDSPTGGSRVHWSVKKPSAEGLRLAETEASRLEREAACNRVRSGVIGATPPGWYDEAESRAQKQAAIARDKVIAADLGLVIAD